MRPSVSRYAICSSTSSRAMNRCQMGNDRVYLKWSPFRESTSYAQAKQLSKFREIHKLTFHVAGADINLLGFGKTDGTYGL